MANGDQEGPKKKQNPIDAMLGTTPSGPSIQSGSVSFRVTGGGSPEVPDDPLHRFYQENFPEYVHEGQDFGASSVPRSSQINIIDYIVNKEPDLQWQQRPRDLSPLEYFGKAAKESTLYPFQLFMGETEEARELTTDPTNVDKIASLLGSFTGMGIGYIPFGLGTSLLFRGIGLTARQAGPILYRVIHGATSFGLFEAGASERLEDVPKHFLYGAALGAGGEVILAGWAGKNRSAFKTPKGTIANPDALAIEQQLRLHEGKSPQEIEAILKGLGSEDDQLAYVAAAVAKQHRPFGSAIIPGIQEPERVIEHLKAVMPNTQFAPHRAKLGVVNGKTQYSEYAEVLIANSTEELSGIQGLRAETFQKLARFLEEGDRAFSFDEAVKLIRDIHIPGESLENPVMEVVDYHKLQELWRARGGNPDQAVLGFANAPENLLAVAGEHARAFETLMHEYTHLVTSVSGQFGRRTLERLSQIFPGVHEPTAVSRMTGLVKIGFDDVTGINKELRDVTIEVIKKLRGMSHTEATAWVKADWRYFGTNTEMLSRLVELMSVAPTLSKTLAPQASKLMAEYIEANSPKLKWLLSRVDLRAVDDLMNYRWRQGASEGITFWRVDRTKLGIKQLRQFQVEGGYPGMGVMVEGRYMRWGGIRDVPEGSVRLIDPKTGERVVKPLTDVQRPLFPQVVERNRQVMQKVGELLEKRPPWVGFVAKNPEGFLQKGLVDLRQLEEMPSLWEYWKANKEEIIKFYRTANTDIGLPPSGAGGPEHVGEIPRQLRRRLREAILTYVSETKDKAGILLNDNGTFKILLDDYKGSRAIRLGDKFSNNFGVVQDKWKRTVTIGGAIINPEGAMKVGTQGIETFTEIVPSFRNAMESMFLEAGVLPREMPYFMGYAEDQLGENLLKLFDKPMREISQEAEDLIHKYIVSFGDDSDSLASRADLKLSKDVNGDLKVVTQDNQIVGRFTNEAEARSFISRTGGVLDAPDLVPDAQIPTNALGSSYTPVAKVMPQQTMPAKLPQSRGIHRFFDSLNLFGSAFTALESVARSIEKLGIGPAFSRIFDPAQRAIVEVDNLMARVPRPGLGGMTFEAQLKKIEGLAVPLARDRQELVVNWVEYLSREEVARPGGYLVRGMNQEEITIANDMVKLGMQDEMPRLLTLNRMMRSFLSNRDKFLNRVYPRALRDRNLSPEKMELLERLKGVAGEIDNKPELMDALGLTKEERWVIDMIDSNVGKGKDNFSLTAVARYASAKPLEKGYKSGREMFAAQHGMNAHELQLGAELDKLFTEAFKVSGLDPKRALGGYWPHLRQFSMWGIGPDDALFKKEVPEFVEWVSTRYRTGELDVYNFDPVMTGFKHVRNMLMKEAFDPILPDLKMAVRNLKAVDSRAGRIMEEYVFELLGRPHASFDKMNDWIKSSANALGFEVSDDFAQKVINGLTSLAYGASIPFRPALIARNYFQMAQMIPGRTGPESFFHGLSRALTQEGFEEALAAGAVEIHRLPLFASTEVFGIGTQQLRTMYPLLNQAGYRWRSAFDRGFTWYRKADDLGRAVAYHAQKHRITKYADDFHKGKIDFETFKQKAKIKTFDEIDEAKFDALWEAGQFDEAAAEMGRSLARETHFRYGHANHPAGWGSVYGRLFGQFGTFPVQYKDYIQQGLRRGTTLDKAEFLATHLAVNGSIVAAGAAAGVNLWSWVVLPSLNYTGGPYADMAVNLFQSIGGSPTERSLAVRNLKLLLPTLEDPESIFVPGSYLLGDIAEAFEQNGGWEAFLTAGGLRVVQPYEPSPMDQIFDFIP